MAAKDKYHDVVKKALEKDGWTITDDPLRIDTGSRIIKIDVGAERLIGAEKGEEKIAVEIKSFLGLSPLTDFYAALGQFLYYQSALKKSEPERLLFLAIPDSTYDTLFTEDLTREIIANYHVCIAVYDINKLKITKWIKK